MRSLSGASALLAAATILAMATTLSGCAGVKYSQPLGSSLDEMDPIVLNLSDWDPPNATLTTPLAEFASEVESRTGGKISFQEFYSASLMPANEQLSGIGTGVADVGRLVASYTPQELPLNNWMMELGSTSVPTFPQGLVQGSATSQEILTTNPEILGEFEEHNVVPLMAMNPSQEYSMICTEEVTDPADARGIRARTAGALWSKEMSSIGMEPVSLPMSEVYEGLQRGVIECAANTVPSMMYTGMWDVGDYLLPVQMSQLNSLPFVINKDLWTNLPGEAQQIMRDAAMTAWERSVEETIKSYEVMAREGVGDRGITVVDPSGFEDPLASYQEQAVQDMSQVAPEGISDPDAFVQEYQKTQAKWEDVVMEEMPPETLDIDPETIIESYRTGVNFDLSGVSSGLSEEMKER